jgi:hypothetical protein
MALMPLTRMSVTRRRRSPAMTVLIVSPSAMNVARAFQNVHFGASVPGMHGALHAACAGAAVASVPTATRSACRFIEARTYQCPRPLMSRTCARMIAS